METAPPLKRLCADGGCSGPKLREQLRQAGLRESLVEVVWKPIPVQLHRTLHPEPVRRLGSPCIAGLCQFICRIIVPCRVACLQSLVFQSVRRCHACKELHSAACRHPTQRKLRRDAPGVRTAPSQRPGSVAGNPLGPSGTAQRPGHKPASDARKSEPKARQPEVLPFRSPPQRGLAEGQMDAVRTGGGTQGRSVLGRAINPAARAQVELTCIRAGAAARTPPVQIQRRQIRSGYRLGSVGAGPPKRPPGADQEFASRPRTVACSVVSPAARELPPQQGSPSDQSVRRPPAPLTTGASAMLS